MCDNCGHTEHRNSGNGTCATCDASLASLLSSLSTEQGTANVASLVSGVGFTLVEVRDSGTYAEVIVSGACHAEAVNRQDGAAGWSYVILR